VAELSPGLWYVDLTRATSEQIQPTLPRLAEARGVVFDMRGYPTDAGAAILPHLLAAPERDRWMHTDRITGPFGRVAGAADYGWDMDPKAPAIGAQRVFLTDGRAISYAESVMGYVADRKLGAIVGAPTAGTNGNVASFGVPGGWQITFTGMRVTRHDGTSRRHLIGIAPDVPLAPTIDGIRRGRDELLDAAIALIDRRQRVLAR
jgi:peptidase S41-like protein